MATSLGIHVDIHLDDAYASALPFGADLLARGYQVSIALPTGLLTGDRLEGLLDAPLATVSEIEDFVHLGGTLVPHGHLHLRNALHNRRELVQDALRAVRLVRDLTGRDPDEFVAPYGRISRPVLRQLRDAGIGTVHLLSHLSSLSFMSPTLSGRYCIENSTTRTAEEFLLAPVNDFRLRPSR
ncbi:polysaccharide deacetylase family protein [Amycolatopsis solani]|nr:polysaccharide deacetylase family protein [Amycolatopsis sp. MEP2-6]